MTLRLVQLTDAAGRRLVAAVDSGRRGRAVEGVATSYELGCRAIAAGRSLAETVEMLGLGEEIDIFAALAQHRVLAPLDHPDPAHLMVSGTGLTHLGSAEGRDQMHRDLADAARLTDSMKMFKLGIEGGRPAPGARGVQPEWFYKGDGAAVIAPEGSFVSPGFALDGGEEPEIAGLYIIGPDGTPSRLGFALGNEFSDHVTERINYLYLAHSKLRCCSFGPEILAGPLPASITGRSRIRRGNEILWDKEFVSGEDNMCHSIRNLEEHHFKYAGFRRPGDVHVHFFGAATLSFSAGVRAEPGDLFEIEADAFAFPLRNGLMREAETPIKTRAL